MTKNLTRIAGLIVLAAALRFSAEGAVFTVINTANSGTGSLRDAITQANALPGKDTIVFNIPGATPHTISPTTATALPSIVDPVVIDGTTQPGYAGSPVVGLVGTGAGTASGLVIQANDSEVRALFINRFTGSGILISSAHSNVVAGCFIGTSPAGTAKLANTVAGIVIGASRGNRIGGTSAADRNIISGNLLGLWINGLSATGNVVQGNFIGTDIDGNTALGNGQHGVLLGGPNNLIGGTVTAARNLISGNGLSGVYLNDAFASNNWVCGNYIGTKSNGTVSLSNGKDGVTIYGASRNLIGGSAPGAGNVISANIERGIYLFPSDFPVIGNRIEGNLIGTDATGRANLGNGFSGVNIAVASGTVIGGTNAAARNIISGNELSGVSIESNAVANVVRGNFIGLDVTGTNALPNMLNGVSVARGTSNIIGGAIVGAGNVISGNAQNGVRLTGGTGTFVQGNLIGTDASGRLARPNAVDGVRIEATSNFIGGDIVLGRNIISGNNRVGVSLVGTSASNNVIAGNFIGADVTGLAALANYTGIAITNAARNFIGTTNPFGGNVIAGNLNSGVDVLGTGATGNRIRGNLIGTDATGNAALVQNNPGIFIIGAPGNIIGGSEAGAGNVISGHNNTAVVISLVGATGNVVQGNFIGTTANGVTPLPNRNHGVEMKNAASGNVIGGLAPGEGNRIGFAAVTGYDGVRVQDTSAGNFIRGNTIFGNAELATDLGAGNITANDLNDGDTGANTLQNFPVITVATGRYITTITGTLNSRPDATFFLDFYGSDNAAGQGGRYLGSTTVNTIGNNATFSVTFTNTVNVGSSVSASATDVMGNTSELSVRANVAPATDTDDDGLPDDFEIAFGLNPASGADGHTDTINDGLDTDLDSDGDGVSNYKELLAGTKPNEATSALRVKIYPEATRTLLSIPTVAGATYRVESATAVIGPWTILADGVAGTGLPLRIADPATGAARFYRVRAN